MNNPKRGWWYVAKMFAAACLAAVAVAVLSVSFGILLIVVFGGSPRYMGW